MMEYKLRFYLSRVTTSNGKIKSQSWGKLHYCGHTLQEAAEKICSWVSDKRVDDGAVSIKLVCTSFLIQRGRERGKNIKWTDYEKARTNGFDSRNPIPFVRRSSRKG